MGRRGYPPEFRRRYWTCSQQAARPPNWRMTWTSARRRSTPGTAKTVSTAA
ncbi:hypothetical protein ACFQQB_11580 [Nonomuraea rubra]|uniref:hypothetical protein n=1 Tax=Nonomuraea rubra TaxID=46180 RepID=UPI003606448B